MSQPRVRKLSSSMGAQTGPRVRGAALEASGDSVPCEPSGNIRSKEHSKRSTSKNKIPKSIRYDLENALVGLCNVWFEEIKPHLVRNKIKVHMHEGEASGDHARLPPSAPLCSHLHPGAASDVRGMRTTLHSHQRTDVSYVDSYSTRPTASRAPSRRPARLLPPFPQAPTLSTPPNPRQSNNQNDCVQCKGAQAQRPRKRRRHRLPLPLYQSYWQKPRLSRTRSSLSPQVPSRVFRSRTRTVLSPTRTCDKNCPKPSENPKLKNVGTQTVVTRILVKKDAKLSLRSSNSPVRCSKAQTKCQKSPTACQKSPTPCPKSLTPCLKPTRCSKSPTLSPARSPPSSPRAKAHVLPKQLRIAESRPLFSYDLIDAIGEAHDKRLRLIYKSPVRNTESSSIMNLMIYPTRRLRSDDVERKPWR